MTLNIKSEIRPNYLDWAKVLGVYFVVFAHYVSPLNIPFSNNLLWNNTYNVTLFHVPLFFIIAGMLYKVRPIKEEFKRSIHRLMIPYFLISAICLIIYAIIKSISFNQFVLNTIGIFSGYDFYHYAYFGEISGSLWLIWSLCSIRIMVSLYYHCIENKRHWFAYGMLVLFFITTIITIFKGNVLPFRIDSSSIGLLFFILGYKGKYYLEKINTVNIRYLLLITGIALSILVISAYYNIDYDTLGTSLSINRCAWGRNFILFLINGISGAVLVFVFSRLLSLFKSKIIMNISNGTTIILGFHFIFYQFFNGIIKYDNFFIALLFSLFILFLCYMIIIFSKKYFPFLVSEIKYKR